MRFKTVWLIYAIYILLIGIAAFGDHSLGANKTFAGIALKSSTIVRVSPDTAPRFDFVDGMSAYNIIFTPNIGGFMVYMFAGTVIACLLQGKE